MLSDPHDLALFDGFEFLTPTAAASQRALERTRDALLHRAAAGETGARHRSRLRFLAYGGLAATFALAACLVAIHYKAGRGRGAEVALVKGSDPKGELQPVDAGSKRSAEATTMTVEIKPPQNDKFPGRDQYVAPVIHAQVADGAPVLVANGGKDPIRLGSVTSEGGGLLHVWDWSTNVSSRTIPGIEFRGNERVVLTPDGKQLVWASGKILDWGTGKWTTIDLGGADVRVGDATYNRIGDMRFSPDGSRLALLVTNFVKDSPGHIESDVVHIVEFPGGRALCDFPAGEQYALRVGFSSDGKQIASGDSELKISRRDSATGKILKSYAPRLSSQVIAVAISPDGKYVAASQREPGNLYIWESDTGRLVHGISGVDLQKLGGRMVANGVMRFSPDGKLLAAAYWGRLFVFDMATGNTVAALKEGLGTSVQWSADGQTLTVVTAVTVGESAVGGRENTYPNIHRWDWRNNKEIELTGESPAK